MIFCVGKVNTHVIAPLVLARSSQTNIFLSVLSVETVEMTTVNDGTVCARELSHGIFSCVTPTFFARIRATRRDVSDGHQFSPNAFIAAHSSLCMAQSPFYTHIHIIMVFKINWPTKLQYMVDRATEWRIHSSHYIAVTPWLLECYLPGISHCSSRLSCTSHILPICFSYKWQ